MQVAVEAAVPDPGVNATTHGYELRFSAGTTRALNHGVISPLPQQFIKRK